MPRQDPGIHRREVRTALREAREAAGKTQQEVADALDWSLSKIIRIESGKVGVSTIDLGALLDFYEVQSRQIREHLIVSARIGRERPWWHPFQDVIRPQLRQLLAYENAALSMANYHPSLINGLLQTREYARALRRRMVDPNILDRLLDFLGRRASVFFEEVSPDVEFFIDEAALRRPIGGYSVMQWQLLHLKDVMQWQGISVRIVPFSAGENQALNGPFTLINFDDGDGSSVALYLEGAQADTIYRDDNGLAKEDVDLISEYTAALDEIREMALTEEDSIKLLDEIIEEHGQAIEAGRS